MCGLGSKLEYMSTQGYGSPTHSSLTRSKPPIHLQDRLVSLSDEVSRLREDLVQGLIVTETLERNTEKQMEVLNGQVGALKTAFVDLSEAVIGQLDQVKGELMEQADARIAAIAPKIESLYTALERNAEDYSRLEGRLIAFQQDTNLQLQEMQQRQSLLMKDFSTLRGQLNSSADRLDRVHSELSAQVSSCSAASE